MTQTTCYLLIVLLNVCQQLTVSTEDEPYSQTSVRAQIASVYNADSNPPLAPTPHPPKNTKKSTQKTSITERFYNLFCQENQSAQNIFGNIEILTVRFCLSPGQLKKSCKILKSGLKIKFSEGELLVQIQLLFHILLSKVEMESLFEFLNVFLRN